MGRRPLRGGLRGGHAALVPGTDGETLPGMTRLSVPDVAREANVDETFVRRLLDMGAVGDDEGLLGDRDVRRVRLLHSWERAGLRADLVVRTLEAGELSLDFLDTPMMAGAGPADRTYGELCADENVPMSLVSSLHEAMGFAAPAAGDRARGDDAQVIDAVRTFTGFGASRARSACSACMRTPSAAWRRPRPSCTSPRSRTTPGCRHGRAPPHGVRLRRRGAHHRLVGSRDRGDLPTTPRARLDRAFHEPCRGRTRHRGPAPSRSATSLDLLRRPHRVYGAHRTTWGRARRPRRGGARRARRGDLGPTSWTTDPMAR